MSDNTKTYASRCLGADVSFTVPATVEALDAQIGRKGATLEQALKNCVYHSWNPLFRAAFAARLVAETGIERPVKKDAKGQPVTFTKTNDDGEKVTENVLITEQDYVNLLNAKEAISAVDFQTMAQEVADEIPFDASPKSRSGKPAKKHYATADTLLAQFKAGERTEDEFKKKFLETQGVSFDSIGDGTGELNRDNLAAGVKLNEQRLASIADQSL